MFEEPFVKKNSPKNMKDKKKAREQFKKRKIIILEL